MEERQREDDIATERLMPDGYFLQMWVHGYDTKQPREGAL